MKLQKMFNNNSIIRQLFALPLILGALILLVGISGIFFTQKFSHHIENINDSDVKPSFVLDEISINLAKISNRVLKFHNPNLNEKQKIELAEEIKWQLIRINKLEKEQLQSSEGEEYFYLYSKWDEKWNMFYIKMGNILDKKDDENAITINPELVDKDINVLIEDLTVIKDMLKYGVIRIISDSVELSKWSIIVLSLTLFSGITIALFSSFILVRNINKLFTEIDESKKSIEVLFNNLDEGFFIFNKEGVIQKGVSRTAQKIFSKDLVGCNFVDILPFSESQKKQVIAWQQIAFMGSFDFSEFKTVAPNSFEIDKKYYELDFRPIYSANNTLEKIICITIDKTVERRFRQIADEEAALVKLVISIINDKRNFKNTIKDIRNIIHKIHEEVNSQNPNIGNLLRDIHTLKGNCANYHIISISKKAHSFETKVASFIKQHGLSNYDVLFAELKQDIDNIDNIFERFMDANERVFNSLAGNDIEEAKPINKNTISEFAHILSQSLGYDSEVFSFYVKHFINDNLALFFTQYDAIVKNLAIRKNKRARVQLLNSELNVSLEPYRSLLSSFAHIFRNAVDHGIETESERRKQGKPIEGLITVAFRKDTTSTGEKLIFEISDDGKGINWENIRDLAVTKGLITKEVAQSLSAHDSLQLIFLQGFSTAAYVTDLSGRGVGTEAVMFEAKKMGGEVWVKSELGKGTCFTIEVPNLESLIFTESDSDLSKTKAS